MHSEHTRIGTTFYHLSPAMSDDCIIDSHVSLCDSSLPDGTRKHGTAYAVALSQLVERQDIKMHISSNILILNILLHQTSSQNVSSRTKNRSLSPQDSKGRHLQEEGWTSQNRGGASRSTKRIETWRSTC